jgi:hypothetical protein
MQFTLRVWKIEPEHSGIPESTGMSDESRGLAFGGLRRHCYP